MEAYISNSALTYDNSTRTPPVTFPYRTRRQLKKIAQNRNNNRLQEHEHTMLK
jgi:hypothetical protein